MSKLSDNIHADIASQIRAIGFHSPWFIAALAQEMQTNPPTVDKQFFYIRWVDKVFANTLHEFNLSRNKDGNMKLESLRVVTRHKGNDYDTMMIVFDKTYRQTPAGFKCRDEIRQDILDATLLQLAADALKEHPELVSEFKKYGFDPASHQLLWDGDNGTELGFEIRVPIINDNIWGAERVCFRFCADIPTKETQYRITDIEPIPQYVEIGEDKNRNWNDFPTRTVIWDPKQLKTKEQWLDMFSMHTHPERTPGREKQQGENESIDHSNIITLQQAIQQYLSTGPGQQNSPPRSRRP